MPAAGEVAPDKDSCPRQRRWHDRGPWAGKSSSCSSHPPCGTRTPAGCVALCAAGQARRGLGFHGGRRCAGCLPYAGKCWAEKGKTGRSESKDGSESRQEVAATTTRPGPAARGTFLPWSSSNVLDQPCEEDQGLVGGAGRPRAGTQGRTQGRASRVAVCSRLLPWEGEDFVIRPESLTSPIWSSGAPLHSPARLLAANFF